MKAHAPLKQEILDSAPPHDVDAERAVIGSVLLLPALLAEVETLVGSDDFYVEAHRILFRVMIELARRGDPIDTTLICNELKRRTDYDRVGGAPYLAEVLQSVPTAANAKYYAGIVREHACKRDIRRVGEQAIRASANGKPASDLLHELQQDLASIGSGGATTGYSPMIVSMADVKSEPVEWLWRDRIPAGKLTLLAGPPGVGKSYLTHYLAAQITRGAEWPDGVSGYAPHGDVLLIGIEDSYPDTVRPRLEAMGADLAKVDALDDVLGVNRIPFNLQLHQFVLDEVLKRKRYKLLVIDPINAFLGRVDSHRDAEVRSILSPLGQLAARHGAALVAVTHLNKSRDGSALNRTMGSVAFTAASRSALLVTEDPGNPQRKLLLPFKSNLCKKAPGLGFSISDCGVRWDANPVAIDADAALAPPLETSNKPGPDQSARKQAVEWLRALLANGPLEAAAIREEAESAGYAWRTVHRAKDELLVTPSRAEFGGQWHWELPANATCQPAAQQENLASWHHSGKHEENCDS